MNDKRIALALVFAAALLPLAATELSLSTGASNYAFNNSGEIKPATPKFGAAFSVRDQILDNLDGVLSFEADPVNGNLLSARAAWETPILGISAGPSFGVLNASGSSDSVTTIFQPGLGIGFTVTIPGTVTLAADTDFALAPASGAAGQVYVQKSRLSAGFFLPNVLCTFAVSQSSNTRYSTLNTRIKSLTDYGLYTEAYRKGSPWRIGVNFIYREADYYIGEKDDANRKIGNLVLGSLLTWSPKNDFSLFLSGDGALYSFSLNKTKIGNLDKLLYNVKAGVTWRTANLGSSAAK